MGISLIEQRRRRVSSKHKCDATNKIKNYHFSKEDRIYIVSRLVDGKPPKQIIQEWNRERKAPSIQSIYSLKMKLKRTGSIHNRKGQGRKRTIVIKENISLIEEELYHDDELSVRELATRLNLKATSVFECLKELNLKSFHFHPEEKLNEPIKSMRVLFCKNFIRLHQSTKFKIWYSDESNFNLNQTTNIHNKRYYSMKNEFRKIQVQKKGKSISVWAAINAEGKIVFEIYEGIQTAENYKERLERNFPLMEMDSHWFQQDGASIHTATIVSTHLNKVCKRRWIGLESNRLFWPPYSPDLSPLDFFLWGYVKDLVFGNNPETTDDLKEKIIQTLNSIPPEMIAKACLSVNERCLNCIEREGERIGHF